MNHSAADLSVWKNVRNKIPFYCCLYHVKPTILLCVNFVLSRDFNDINILKCILGRCKSILILFYMDITTQHSIQIEVQREFYVSFLHTSIFSIPHVGYSKSINNDSSRLSPNANAFLNSKLFVSSSHRTSEL